MRILRPLLAALLMCWLSITVAQATVWIAVSQGSREYEEVADTIRTQLQKSEPVPMDVQIKPWQDLASNGVPAHVRIVVTLGSSALSGLAEASAAGRLPPRMPVVAAMSPRTSIEAHRKRFSGPLTAIALDQPPARQLALLRHAFPGMRRIGVLLGADSQHQQNVFERIAQEQGLQLSSYRVENGSAIYPALQRLLEENDVLLALPDAAIYNGTTIQNILLAAYRQKVPMVGFSAAYIRAGAVLGLYSTGAQIAQQTARVVRGLLAGQNPAPVQSPVDFVVGVNINVARSLGYSLNEEALRTQLLGREAQ